MPLARIIDGKALANKLYEKLKADVEHAKIALGSPPGLCVILVGDDPASHIYVKNKLQMATKLGIAIFPHFLPKDVTQDKLVSIIESANHNDKINGILLQLPLPSHIDTFEVINTVIPEKDVDGFTAYNIGLLNSWHECLEPSTPKGVLMLIHSVLGTNIAGKKAVVLGRSIIVGRPMCSMLIRESCTVELLHSKTLDIKHECKSADILISAIGKPGFITKDYVKPGACVIDVGITRLHDRISGDVDFEDVSKVAGFITPVPGGVGPMTVACMLSNTIEACFRQHKINFKPMDTTKLKQSA